MTSLRTQLVGVVVALVFATMSGPVAAAAGPLIGTVGPGFFGTDNVNLEANIPINSGTAGARVVGEQMFVTDQNGLTVYDVSDPSLPIPQGFVAIPQQYYFTEEDVPSNGEIALVGQFGDLTPSIQLNVVDVSLDDNLAGQPQIIGTLSGMDEHTFECARDCTYAYGSAGAIIDLTDPTNPTQIGDWLDSAGSAHGVRSSHDVTEVVPGILLSSSNPMLLMDIRTTPDAPEVIGVGSFTDGRFIHANLWPYHGDLPENAADPAAEGWEPDWDAFDDFVLVGGETGPLVIGGACGQDDGKFMTMTWDRIDTDADTTADFVEMTFDPANGHGDEYTPEPGTFIDGGSAYSQYCTHWFTTQPADADGAGGYRDGGLLAMGWYEYGVRFLDVEPDTGAISETGWLIPMGGSTSAAYWADRDTILTADYQRGVDILTYDETIPPGETTERMVPGVRFERAIFPRPQAMVDWYEGFGCPLPQ